MKPRKPRPDFPLYAHACGKWACRIDGHTRYFGTWDDPNGALEQYHRERDDWEHGVNPRRAPAGRTVRQLCNEFYTSKASAVEAGELTKRTLREYERTCATLVDVFGNRAVVTLEPADFRTLRSKLAERLGPVALSHEIQRARIVFRYGTDNLGLPQTHYGQEFKRPSQRVLRLDRAAKGKRSFAVDELQAMLGAAPFKIRAMILLGLNCGFGPGDCGKLERGHLDLARGWVEYVRPKTGVPRRAKLWPETVAAIEEVLARRKDPKDGRQWVFVTNQGNPWAGDHGYSPASDEFSKLLRKVGVEADGRGMYGLRHTFRHVADACGDQHAILTIMGHADRTISGVYRGAVDDSRLAAVADHVRKWLFG